MIAILHFYSSQSIAVLSSYDNILNGSCSLGKEKASFESSNTKKAEQQGQDKSPVLIDFDSDKLSSSSSSSHNQSLKSSVYSIAKPPQSSIPNITKYGVYYIL